MRKLLFAFFLLVTSLAYAQSNPARLPAGQAGPAGGAELSIRQILDNQIVAWNQGNIDDFMKGYWENDSLMFIGKSGVTYGWTNTLKNYKKNYPDTAAMGKLSFTLIAVKKLSKEYYHVTGKWFLERSIGNIGGHYTLLFRKINGRWVIVSDHSS